MNRKKENDHDDLRDKVLRTIMYPIANPTIGLKVTETEGHRRHYSALHMGFMSKKL